MSGFPLDTRAEIVEVHRSGLRAEQFERKEEFGCLKLARRRLDPRIW